MVEVTFANPDYLWVLVLVPFLVIVHFFTLRQSRAAAIKFSNFEAVERVAKGDVLSTPYKGILRNKNIGLVLLRAIVYCLLILSVAGTTIWYQGRTSSFDYVFAIDASSSMLADDFSPTRFDASKEAAMKFVELVPSGANIGLVSFASTSLIELRPTSNFQDVRDSILNMEFHKSGGTAIGDAIITSTNLFSVNKSKIIVLITDGQNNVGVDPEIAIDYAKQNDVSVYAIGVATKEGGQVPSLNIVSKLDEGLLRKIADKTFGNFFVVKDTPSLGDAFKEIASTTEKLLSLNISWILLVAVIALLGFEWILINTIYRTIP